MSATYPSTGHDLEIVRTFPVPPVELFRTFTEPRLFKLWVMGSWGRDAELDLRAGGSYHVRGALPSGVPVECLGGFDEVRGPELVAGTFEWRGTPEHPDSCIPEVGPRRMLFELREIPEGTELRFRYEGLSSAGSLECHRGGWSSCFEELAQTLS